VQFLETTDPNAPVEDAVVVRQALTTKLLLPGDAPGSPPLSNAQPMCSDFVAPQTLQRSVEQALKTAAAAANERSALAWRDACNPSRPMNAPIFRVRRWATAAIVLLGMSGCDPETLPTGGATPAQPAAAPAGKTAADPPSRADAKSAEPPGPAVPIAVTTNAVGERRGFVDCLLGCDAAKLTRAQKAACRYNCEDIAPSSPGAPPAPAGVDPDPVATIVLCIDDCAGQGKQAAACASACKHLATGAPAAPSAAVIDELGTCIDACHADRHASATNRATCELNCAETARSAGPAQGAPM
jgi:hypothetical protein